MDTAWHDYFGMLGGAAATLLGLLFVSVSLNAEIIFGSPHKLAMHLAQQAYHNYIIVFVVSLAAFFPEISNRSLGIAILIASAFYTVWLLIRFVRAMTAPLALESRVRALRRYVLTLAGFVALMIGGVWLIPTLCILGRREHPAGYWAVILAAALALTMAFALAAYAATRAI